MEQAFNFRPGKQLLTGFSNNNDKNNPCKKLCHRALVSVAVFTAVICLSLQPTHVQATEVRVQHCQDNRYDARQYHRQQRRHHNRHYRHQRASEQRPTASVKQSFQTPGRSMPNKVRVNPAQPRPAKPKLESPAVDAPQALIPHSDNADIRVKHKGDKTRLIVKQQNNTRKHGHHAKQKHNKTVIHFDDSGLIGYRVDNHPRVELQRPLAKNRYIKKLESQYGDLKRVRVKHKGNKTRVVGVFHSKHAQPDTPAVERPTVKVDVSKPVNSAPLKPGSVTADVNPIKVTESVNNVVPEVDTQTPLATVSPQAKTLAVPTAIQSPETAPRLESVSHAVTLDSVTGNVSTSINGQSNNSVVSIAQPILGRPDPQQPVSSLNIGDGSSSPTLAQQPALPNTVFNTRIAQAGESIEDDQASSSDQVLPYHQVAYVDVNALSQKHYLFGSVGKGIGMKLGQCEQLENCAASIDRQQLANLQQRLKAKIDALEQQLADNVSDSKRIKILRTLKHVKGKLAMVVQQQNLSLAYAATGSVSSSEPVSEKQTADSDTDENSSEVTESYDVSEFDTSLFEDIADVIADD